MIKQNIIITDEDGMHVRPASKISKIAQGYEDAITLTYDDKDVNLKSILAVMSLAIPQDSEVTLSIEGDNEKQTLKDILKAFEDEGIDIKTQ